MEHYLTAAVAICAALIAVGIIVALQKKKKDKAFQNETEVALKMATDPSSENKAMLSIRFEDLPGLTDTEEERLVEIKDHTLLSRLDGVIPGTLQLAANAGAIHKYRKTAHSAGQLYQAIIPKDAVLSRSKVMKGAVRGFYRGKDGIKGQANLKAVDTIAGNRLASMNAINAAMNVAAMVVGQYYMTQINNRLDSIAREVEAIAEFQNNEYKSKVVALITEMQNCAVFRAEIVEDDTWRNRELMHLENMNHECAQLLGQANLTLLDYAGKRDLDYKNYEKNVAVANRWFRYQQLLLVIMSRIGEMTYVFTLGTATKESCSALYQSYVQQSENALDKLKQWHQETDDRLEIDLNSNRRKRQGLEGFIMNVPALFNEDLHYKPISARTVNMIGEHAQSSSIVNIVNDTNLFQKDVRLIVKEGKLYYLPPA